MKHSFFCAIGSPSILALGLGSNVKHDHLDLGVAGVSAGAHASSAGDIGYPDGNGVMSFSAAGRTSSKS